MKKFFIIFTNIILLIFILCFTEFFLFHKYIKDYNLNLKYNFHKKDFSLETMKESSEMRKPCGLEYKKSPILIYGCSFAYGFGLQDKDTFGYKLSELTKRPVYNFAMSAKGLQHTLYLLKNDKKVSPEPEYVFYIFINDHYRRMFVNCNRVDNTKYLTYSLKNDNLIENDNKYGLTDKFFILGTLKNQIYYLFQNIFKKQIHLLGQKHILEINKEIHKKYPNAKFVIINFEINGKSILSKSEIKTLQKNNIDFISLNEELNDMLSMDSYRNDEKKDKFRHPNSKAWDVVTKFIIDKYNL